MARTPLEILQEIYAIQQRRYDRVIDLRDSGSANEYISDDDVDAAEETLKRAELDLAYEAQKSSK